MTEEIIIDVSNCARKRDDDCMEVPICNEYGDLMGYQSCEAQTLCPYRSQKKIEHLEQLKNKYYQQTLDDEITISDLIEEIQTLKSDRTLERISKLNMENARLEQANKALYEEKNCLHKIIDRLLENAGYSKDIASAEDFEDVYEDMQRKVNELAELEQENKELKELNKKICEDLEKAIKVYWNALEKIRDTLKKIFNVYNDDCGNASEITKVVDKINEVLL